MKEIELHTSERSAFGRCQYLWWWKYRMGLVSKYEQPDALWFGIGVHEALAEWYKPGKKRGVRPATTFRKYVGSEIREIRANYRDNVDQWDIEQPKYEDALALGIEMLEGYVDQWGKDEDWEVIAPEQFFRIRIYHNGEYVGTFASTWDLVYRDLKDGLVYLGEHKTAGNKPNLAMLETDDQAGAYWAAAGHILRANGILGPREDIAGIQYNYLMKRMPDERPVDEDGYSLNKDGSVSKKQPPERYLRPSPILRNRHEGKVQFERMGDELFVMNAIRNGDMPLLKTHTRECPYCPFFDMCKLHDRGSGWQAIMKADYIQQDPYADRRKPA